MTCAREQSKGNTFPEENGSISLESSCTREQSKGNTFPRENGSISMESSCSREQSKGNTFPRENGSNPWEVTCAREQSKGNTFTERKSSFLGKSNFRPKRPRIAPKSHFPSQTRRSSVNRIFGQNDSLTTLQTSSTQVDLSKFQAFDARKTYEGT